MATPLQDAVVRVTLNTEEFERKAKRRDEEVKRRRKREERRESRRSARPGGGLGEAGRFVVGQAGLGGVAGGIKGIVGVASIASAILLLDRLGPTLQGFAEALGGKSGSPVIAGLSKAIGNELGLTRDVLNVLRRFGANLTAIENVLDIAAAQGILQPDDAQIPAGNLEVFRRVRQFEARFEQERTRRRDVAAGAAFAQFGSIEDAERFALFVQNAFVTLGRDAIGIIWERFKPFVVPDLSRIIRKELGLG